MVIEEDELVSNSFTFASDMSLGVWVMCHLMYLIALPMLTDRGLHCVKKLEKKFDIYHFRSTKLILNNWAPFRKESYNKM